MGWKLPFPGRRHVEEAIAQFKDPATPGMRLNDGKQRVTLPGGTLEMMLAMLDERPQPDRKATEAFEKVILCLNGSEALLKLVQGKPGAAVAAADTGLLGAASENCKGAREALHLLNRHAQACQAELAAATGRHSAMRQEIARILTSSEEGGNTDAALAAIKKLVETR